MAGLLQPEAIYVFWVICSVLVKISHEHRGLHYIWSKCPQSQCRFCSSHLPADNALVTKPAARRGITANKVKAPWSLVILNTFIVKQRHRKRCVFSRSNWTRLLNQQKNTADVLKLNRFRQKLPKYWEAAPVQTRCWRSESLRLDLTQHNQMCKNSFKIQTFNTNVWYKLK